MKTILLAVSLLASSCLAPTGFESSSARASLQTCSGPCDQTDVRPELGTERVETLTFVGGSFGAEECAKAFDEDGSSRAFFSNGIYPMSCAGWFANRERRVVTRVQVAFCRASPDGEGCDPEPATGAGYVVNVGCGLDDFAVGGPDVTVPAGEHEVASLWDGTHAIGDGALHDVPVQHFAAGSYVALRKAFDGDPIDGHVFTLRIWTAAPGDECAPGETCEDYDCDGVRHCAPPGRGGPINCCTSEASCLPGYCCGDEGKCEADAVCEEPGGGGGGGDEPQPSCGQGPFGFTCECMKKCDGDAACQICCTALTPGFYALCAPNFFDPCAFFGGEGCRAACSALSQPASGACMSACMYARDNWCDGRMVPSPKLLCNFGTWAAGMICEPGPNPYDCRNDCRDSAEGECESCCAAECGASGPTNEACRRMCETRWPI